MLQICKYFKIRKTAYLDGVLSWMESKQYYVRKRRMTSDEVRFKRRTIVLSQIPVLLIILYILIHVYAEKDPLFTQEYSQRVSELTRAELDYHGVVFESPTNEPQIIVKPDGISSFLVELSIFIFIICVLVAGWISAIHINRSERANRQLQELNKRLINMQEEERARVSRELHDGINQILVSTKLRFDNIENASEKASIAEQVKLGQENLELAMDEVRRISKALRPSLLDDFGLLVAINNLRKEFQSRTGIKVVFEYQVDESLFTRDMEHALYRVTQEALCNAEKYSQAQAIDIVLQEEKSHLLYTIADDGAGFELTHIQGSASEYGIGLKNIRERIALLDGHFELNSDSEEGTEIRIMLPLSNSELGEEHDLDFTGR